MEFRIMETYEEICQTVAREIRALIGRKKNATICIAAGHSSLGVFDALLDMYRRGEVDFSECSFAAMDEWLGMNRHDSGSCGDFLWKHFLSKVNFREENVMLPDGRAVPMDQELARIGGFIAGHGGIDYMVLGVGMNGHLALNEPGSSFDSTVRVTELDSVTKRVGLKYFDSTPTLSGGVTIGLRDICRTGRLVLVINGERKAGITKLLHDSPATEEIPATVLKTVDNCTIFCDGPAASRLARRSE